VIFVMAKANVIVYPDKLSCTQAMLNGHVCRVSANHAMVSVICVETSHVA